MTHLYTILVGGSVIPSGGEPVVSAIAWASDTVIALGSDLEVRGTSRGDSHVVDLGGLWVVPLDGDGQARWPVEAILEVGGEADLAILARDPRRGGVADAGRLTPLAVVRGGRMVAGAFPGLDHDHDADEFTVRSG